MNHTNQKKETHFRACFVGVPGSLCFFGSLLKLPLKGKYLAEGREYLMLWIAGSILVLIWLFAKFVMHKGGMIHVVVMIAISMFIIQFVQDRRTKEYERSIGR
jgi:hypothetical protein